MNVVADGLANEGINQGKMTTYQRRKDLPGVSKGYFTLDRGGLAYIKMGRPCYFLFCYFVFAKYQLGPTWLRMILAVELLRFTAVANEYEQFDQSVLDPSF